MRARPQRPAGVAAGRARAVAAIVGACLLAWSAACESPSRPARVGPYIASISPDDIPSGSDGFTLVIDGSGFAAGMVVHWNGAERATVFRSPTQLAAIIPAPELASPKRATVVVFDPATSQSSNARTVTVSSAPQRLLVRPTYPSLFAGDTVRLGLRGLGSGGDTVAAGPATWSSGAPRIASVDPQGVVTGIAPGFAVISAVSGGARGSVTVAVIDPTPRPTRGLAYLVGVLQAAPPPTFTSALTVSRADGTGATRISAADEDVTEFAWSPDGKRLLVTAYRWAGGVGTAFSYTMAADGSDRRLLADTVWDARWSPDGSQLLYYRFVNDNLSHVFTMPAAGGAARALTTGAEPDIRPEWSPDGRQIAYIGGATDYESGFLWLMAADGSDQRRIELPVKAKRVRWSPDGKLLAVTTGRSIHVMSAADGSGRSGVALQCVIYDSCTPDMSLDLPVWSPDGHRIAFATTSEATYLSLLDVRSGSVTDVDVGSCCFFERMSLDWSPDGSLIANQQTRAGATPDRSWSAIAVRAADGSNPRLLTGEEHAYRPRWQP